MTARRSERTRRNARATGTARAEPARLKQAAVSLENTELQRLGNQGTQRLLRRAAGPATAEPTARDGLRLGAAHDPLEREADRAADQVTAAQPAGAAGKTPPRIQRAAAGDGGGARNTTAQPNGRAPGSVQRVLASSGQPLAPTVRADMGERFGHDFSGVRVHTGPQEARSAREINANAYTGRAAHRIRRAPVRPRHAPGPTALGA